MSDTPRTDAESMRLDDWGDSMFYPDFARQLERELNQAIKERNEAEASVRRLTKLLGDALHERDEARECLREAMQASLGILTSETNPKWPEHWRKAAGLEDK